MYGENRYGLTRYSSNREGRAVPADGCFAESMGALAGAAIPVVFRELYGEAVRASAWVTISVTTSFSAGESLGAQVRMAADVLLVEDFPAVLHGDARGRKDLPAGAEMAEALGAFGQGSKTIPMSLTLPARLGAGASGSKNIAAHMAAPEILTAMTQATSQTAERAVFRLTIPPGGELRIDSGLFTVLLDGENALHAQSGDWPAVSRELLRLTVESASGGGLEGQLIYTERYL